MKRFFTVCILVAGSLWCEAQGNALAERRWLPLMQKAMKEEVILYADRSRYKGQLSGEKPSGLGAYQSQDGSWYWGRWKDGVWEGKGIYIAPEDSMLLDCEGCAYYVGEWSSDRPSGMGTCYDKSGKLIYYGGFSDGNPTEAYPSTGYSGYTFECVECGGGNMYLGEKKDGVRNGYGIFLMSDGGAWYGAWKDGKREGYGILLPYQGRAQAGRWTGDDCEEAEYPDDLCFAPSTDEVFMKERTRKAATVSGSKENGREVWKKAMSCYKAGKYAEALPLFRRLAGEGNVQAQYYLGGCYYYAKDDKNAAKWWRKAADQGNADAQLAWLLMSHTRQQYNK